MLGAVMRIACPVTGPFVPIDHACGTASTMNGAGASAASEKLPVFPAESRGRIPRLVVHVRQPPCLHLSHCPLFARVAFGDQVRRGP